MGFSSTERKERTLHNSPGQLGNIKRRSKLLRSVQTTYGLSGQRLVVGYSLPSGHA